MCVYLIPLNCHAPHVFAPSFSAPLNFRAPPKIWIFPVNLVNMSMNSFFHKTKYIGPFSQWKVGSIDGSRWSFRSSHLDSFFKQHSSFGIDYAIKWTFSMKNQQKRLPFIFAQPLIFARPECAKIKGSRKCKEKKVDINRIENIRIWRWFYLYLQVMNIW